jgi:PIN domain nuclease of toxin-antitoxin system
MKFLLDTHTFVWMDSAPNQLSPTVTALVSDPNHTILLSYVSIWELQIKVRLGKLQLSKSLAAVIATEQQNNGLELLSIELRHILTLDILPDIHRDPFDRLLIAQSISEGLPILSRDTEFAKYPVKVIW